MLIVHSLNNELKSYFKQQKVCLDFFFAVGAFSTVPVHPQSTCTAWPQLQNNRIAGSSTVHSIMHHMESTHCDSHHRKMLIFA